MKTKEWLKKQRKINNLSQAQLANKIGVSKATIENIEQEKRLGSVETWDKIEKFFADIDINEDLEICDAVEDLGIDGIVDELKKDIEEFGKDTPCILVYKIVSNSIIFTNYDFIVDEEPFDPAKELDDDEKYLKTTFEYALEVFENQNKIL